MVEIYERILRYIDAHIDGDITIEELQTETGYSRRHLYRLFKMYSDIPIAEYIRKRKLSAAAEKMRSCENLCELALNYGYETPAGFYKAFYNIYDCSPSDYKNNTMRRKIMEEKKTIDELNKLIALEPENAAHYVERARLYVNDMRYSRAIPDLEKAIALSPTVEAYSLLDHMYTAKKRHDDALYCAEKVVELAPNKSGNYLTRGEKYKKLGRYEAALADYNRAVELNPKSSTAYMFRGIYYYQRGETERAWADFAKMIETGESQSVENLSAIYFNRGNMFTMLRLNEQAKSDFDTAIELDPKNSRAYLMRALARMRDRDYESALSDYNRAIELDPENPDLYINRAPCYYYLGKTDMADEDYNRAVELGKGSAKMWIYAQRGDNLREQKRLDEAVECYKKAVEVAPELFWPMSSLADTYMEMRRFDEALECYDKVLEIDPNVDYVYLSRANIYAALDRREDAIAEFQRAIERDPSNIYVYSPLADLYMKTGETDKAYENYERFAQLVEAKSDNNEYITGLYAWSFINRAFISAGRGENETAVSLALRAVEIEPDNAFHYYNLVNLGAFYLTDTPTVERLCKIALEYYDRAVGLYTRKFGMTMNVRDERDWQTRIYRWRAACHEAMGETDKAEEDYNKSVGLEQDKSYIFRFRVSRCLRACDYEKAAKLARLALNGMLGPKPSTVARAYEYIADMQSDAAIKLLREVCKDDTEFTQVSELLEALDI